MHTKISARNAAAYPPGPPPITASCVFVDIRITRILLELFHFKDTKRQDISEEERVENLKELGAYSFLILDRTKS